MNENFMKKQEINIVGGFVVIYLFNKVKYVNFVYKFFGKNFIF